MQLIHYTLYYYLDILRYPMWVDRPIGTPLSSPSLWMRILNNVYALITQIYIILFTALNSQASAYKKPSKHALIQYT